MEPAHKKAIHPVAIFKESWRLYLQHFRTLTAITAITYTPAAALGIIRAEHFKTTGPGAGFLLLTLVALLINVWGYLALVLCAHKAGAGEACGVGMSLRGAGKHFLPYLGTAFLSSLVIGSCCMVAGFIVFGATLLRHPRMSVTMILQITALSAVSITALTVAVYCMLRWSLNGIVCVAESAGPVTALKRSRRLVKDYINPVVGEFCLIIAVFIVGAMPQFAAQAIFGKGNPALKAVTDVCDLIINCALFPLYAVILVGLYSRLREAVEG